MRKEDREDWEVLESNWDTVVMELDRQAERLRDRLSNPGDTEDIEHVRAMQAEIKALNTLRTLPSVKLKEIDAKSIRKDR